MHGGPLTQVPPGGLHRVLGNECEGTVAGLHPEQARLLAAGHLRSVIQDYVAQGLGGLVKTRGGGKGGGRGGEMVRRARHDDIVAVYSPTMRIPTTAKANTRARKTRAWGGLTGAKVGWALGRLGRGLGLVGLDGMR
jgi:hypothetical protein